MLRTARLTVAELKQRLEAHPDPDAQVIIITRRGEDHARCNVVEVWGGESFFDVRENDVFTLEVDLDVGDGNGEPPLECPDCGRPTVYDDATETYRHIDEPERGCFLIAPESA